MSTTRPFSLKLETLFVRQAADGGSAPGAPVLEAQPVLQTLLAQLGSLPREALFLGVAPDGLPVLLNLHDPVPGPVLIAAEAGGGRTAFLRLLAQSLQHTHGPEELRFGVVTNRPAEWDDLGGTAHGLGIYSVYHDEAWAFLAGAVRWARENRSRHTLVLLLDDLDALTSMPAQAVQDLRWLLLRGPAHRAWPFVTLQAERYAEVLSWVPMFRTRLFGRISQPELGEALGADAAAGLERLEPAVRYVLREHGQWLPFWLPRASAL